MRRFLIFLFVVGFFFPLFSEEQEKIILYRKKPKKKVEKEEDSSTGSLSLLSSPRRRRRPTWIFYIGYQAGFSINQVVSSKQEDGWKISPTFSHFFRIETLYRKKIIPRIPAVLGGIMYFGYYSMALKVKQTTPDGEERALIYYDGIFTGGLALYYKMHFLYLTDKIIEGFKPKWGRNIYLYPMAGVYVTYPTSAIIEVEVVQDTYSITEFFPAVHLAILGGLGVEYRFTKYFRAFIEAFYERSLVPVFSPIRSRVFNLEEIRYQGFRFSWGAKLRIWSI